VFDKHLFNDTFWAFYRGINDAPFFQIIKKPYVQYVPGALKSCKFDFETGVFDCVWTEDGISGGAVRIWVPDLSLVMEDEIVTSPARADIELEAPDNTAGGFVIISPAKRNGERRLQLRLMRE
jgi:hypothetical protein